MATALGSSHLLSPRAAYYMPANEHESIKASSYSPLRIGKLQRALKGTTASVRVLKYASAKGICPRANAANEEESYVHTADNTNPAPIGPASHCLQTACEAKPNRQQQVREIPLIQQLCVISIHCIVCQTTHRAQFTSGKPGSCHVSKVQPCIAHYCTDSGIKYVE